MHWKASLDEHDNSEPAALDKSARYVEVGIQTNKPREDCPFASARMRQTGNKPIARPRRPIPRAPIGMADYPFHGGETPDLIVSRPIDQGNY